MGVRRIVSPFSRYTLWNTVLTITQVSDLLDEIEKGKLAPPGELRKSDPLPPKRKASTDLPRSNGKQIKTEQNAANTSRPIAPARGLSSSSKMEGAVVKSESKVGSNGSAVQNRPAAVPAKPAAPPKKGSYAEIMARAKESQKTVYQAGKIQHKTMERGQATASSKTGRSAGGASWSKPKGAIPGTKDAKNGSVRPGEKDGSNGMGKGKETNGRNTTRVEEPVKKVKKAATATTGYTGTARPKTALLKSSPRVGNSISAAAPRRDSAPASRPLKNSGARYERPAQRYRYADEEEEDEDDYASDVSSDMEAAGFEVDEEEEQALRQAKLEDAEEERRLRREAEEKRRRKAMAGR